MASAPAPSSLTSPSPPSLDRALRALTILAVLALGVTGIALPESVLCGGVAWLGFLFFVLSGLGYLVTRVRRVEDPDFGLRAAWGASAYIAIAGVLVALGVCSRPAILALIGVGAAGFAMRELMSPIATWHHARDGVRCVRANPAFGVLVIALVALAVVQIVGAVATLDRNPWDDDIAYTPLIKRLLDTGDLVEPFSFRRMSAYGGQTVLGALGGARGTVANVNLIDHALCYGIALLAVAGMARERRARLLSITLLMLALLLMPETAINTASHWSGMLLFLALYRTIERDWSVVGLVGAAASTLRQNYIVVVVLFVGVVLVKRLRSARRETSWGSAWNHERMHWRAVTIVAFASTLAWWIAAYRSNHTFLFPVFEGTFNHELAFRPEVVTWTDEVVAIVRSCLETTPIVVVPILFALLVFSEDERPGTPLRSLFIAVTLGFLWLVHSFVGSEPSPMWRYAFGFGVALFAVFVLEVEATIERSVRMVPLGRWLLLATLVLQLLAGRASLPKHFTNLVASIREASTASTGDPTAEVERRRYVAMQDAIPEGARVAVMLDDAAYLDFSRNPIANLDTPGFASPGSQLPSFRGAEPMREYLVAEGYRYLAFVRSDRSRYFYRRGFWLWRIFNDSELFEVMSAYAIDTIDSFAELATTTTVRYDTDGLVVLDLEHPVRSATTRPTLATERERRSVWVHELATREGLEDAWSLHTRSDVRFEDGIQDLQWVDGGIDDPKWFEISRPQTSTPLRGTPIRALQRRAHLRIRGEHASNMRLTMRIAIALASVYTRPRLDVSVDGELLASVVADDRGRYAIDQVISKARLNDGWHDVYLVFSSISEPEKDTRDLRVARFESVGWTAVP